MRTLGPALALLAGAGCGAAMRGPDTCTEIHFETTYALARWSGWPPADAAAIAAADAWTDEHPETTSVATERRVAGGLVNPLTIPRIVTCAIGDLAEGETLRRAIGRRVAEATAWAVPELGLRLHFPAAGIHSPVGPAFLVNPATGELDYGNAEARRVLEQAFLDLETRDEDAAATLALLGMGLHTLQDSFKHCGFDGAMGHIGARPDPDAAAQDLGLALRSADAVLHSLRYARRLAAGHSSKPPPAWKEDLRDVLSDVSKDRWPAFFRAHFDEAPPDRDEILVRWRRDGGLEAFDRAVSCARELFR
jgi:hypothetical protein